MTTALDRRSTRPHAWLFAITASLGLLPGTYGLVMAAFTGILLPPVLWLWSIGLALLIGYWMVALRRPMPDGAGLLWVGSAIYNAALALAWSVLGLEGLVRAAERGSWAEVAAFVCSVLWFLFLAGVSAHATERVARAA